MPKKTIPELTEITHNLLYPTDCIEISQNNNSFKVTLETIGKAVFSKIKVDVTDPVNKKTIEQNIEEVNNKNSFPEDIILIDEKGGKWKLFINGTTRQLEYERIIN